MLIDFFLESMKIFMPFEAFEPRFMRMALLGLLLLSPMTSLLGIQVVNHRLAFFSDAVGHSVFAGVAAALFLGISAYLSMPLVGVLVGMVVMYLESQGRLSTDTTIGVVFSGVIALGLVMMSREASVMKNMQRFLYGDILTIDETSLLFFGGMLFVLILFNLFFYNDLLLVSINPHLAKAHGIRVKMLKYFLSILLSVTVIFALWAVGVFLVTALLIVPAATARNFSSRGRDIFWWALGVGFFSSIVGLLISAQDWARTASGPTIVLCSLGCFFVSLLRLKAVKK